MKRVAKALSVFTNLCNYGVGIAVCIILIAKLDFVSIFYVHGMTSNMCLYFNMVLFQAGLAVISVVLCMLANEYDKKTATVEFPTLYMLLPLAVSLVSIFYGIKGDTTAEKIFVIVAAVVYFVLSAVTIYCGSRIFQLYPKDNKE